MIYRALISVEKLTPVEVEASSEWEAKDAILHSCFSRQGDSTYRHPLILNLMPVIPLPASYEGSLERRQLRVNYQSKTADEM